LDRSPRRGDRWQAWRPSVAICQHDDFVVDRFELLFDKKHQRLTDQVSADIGTTSPETELRQHAIEFEDPWDFEEVFACLHDFANTYEFDVEREDYLIHITTGTHVAQICLFLLTESRHLPGRLLQSSPPRRASGAASGTIKMIDLDLSKYDALATRFQQQAQESVQFLKGGISTRSESFNELIEQIERVCLLTKAPILLTGPTGAGKSLLAKRIFQLKQNRNLVLGSFVEVNCATLRGEQAMSTLFGHRRGAFTGATEDRPGLLKTADGGVLFLDEIGELGLDEQAMLLKAIEEKVFWPVGSDQAAQSDFQVIAGTNRDLAEQVVAGKFREDLLARINLWHFELPGLAQRREDIDPNIDFELDRFERTNNRKVTINKEARQQYLEFANSEAAAWVGNFRDLSSSISRMATLADSGRITTEDVRQELKRLRDTSSNWKLGNTSGLQGDTASAMQVLRRYLSESACSKLDRFDLVQLADVVSVCQRSSSLSDAGRKLFAHSRLSKQKANDADRLRKYLARFDLNWADLRPQ
ncbi:MAG TPA: transcriptional regulator, partial [Planctomycetaceae bacterium]|nr:transcriptional regulator [Planctomycetaceae bacterium]